LETFVRRLPHERGVARREIERLILFLGPGANTTGSLADLAGFFGVEPEASLGDAAFDAFGGKPAAAHAGLRRAALEGEGGVGAVRAMGLHLGRLRRVAVLRRSGTPAQAAAKAAGVFWRNEREFLRQSQVWTLPELDRAQVDILAADRACKQAGTPDQLLAERLAIAIAGRARRLGL
jgi:DNA polymerase-3 subunit delta